jgi:hypothetical protein
MRGARGIWVRTAIAGPAAIAALFVVGSSPTAAVGGSPSFVCEFSPVERALSIRALGDLGRVSLERADDTIVVAVSSAGPLTCTGGAPTVNNIDSIVASAVRGAADNTLIVDLDHPMAPGFTDEGDGGSEIEIRALFRGAQDGGLRIVGTQRSDAVTLGATAGGPGANLNPGEASPDADLTLGRIARFVFSGGRGADSIDAAGRGAAFRGPFARNTRLIGGPGADELEGGPRKDLVRGGTGKDQIATGDEKDHVLVRDGQRDQVRCGRDDDSGAADLRDQLRGCEFGGTSRGLVAVKTSRKLRKTIPIARRDGGKTRSVLSLDLPRLGQGDRIRLNGELILSTTCDFPPSHDCIGRRYLFDPHMHARAVLASRKAESGRGTLPVSRRDSVTCEQTAPNINHHCPLVISRGSFRVRRLRELPCRPRACRLNLVVDVHNPGARGGELVTVGTNMPQGIGKGGGRLNAVIIREGARVNSIRRSTTRRRARKLPASFDAGRKVVYSQRVPSLRRRDVLLIRARQRTAIKRHRYYIASKVVVATRPRARWPGPLARRSVWFRGTATAENGFNCTLGPSAFRSPCLRKKAGLALIERTPRGQRGGIRPLYVNLVSRGFPKVGEVPGSYPPARVLSGGLLTVTRLRAERTRPR